MIDNQPQTETSLQARVEVLLQTWTQQHNLSFDEQQRLLRVWELDKPLEQDFFDELENVLARRRINTIKLDPAKLIAMGDAYRAEMRRRRDAGESLPER